MKRVIAAFALVLMSTALSASELDVRESPESYPHTCSVDGAELGVDYLRRSLPTPLGMQHIPGVLIVERRGDGCFSQARPERETACRQL